MSKDVITVTISKWEKYNPRSDVKKPSWFRVEYSILEDPDFYEFTHEEFKAFFYLMAQACKKNSPQVRVNFAHAEATAKLSQKGVLKAIEKLEELKIVTVDVTEAERTRYADDTHTNATGRDGTERNETGRDGTPPPAESLTFDFESLYQKYPLRKGKAEGIERCEKQIKTQADFDDLSKAIDRYKLDLEISGTEKGFIKHFSSFMGTGKKRPWRDWLDEDAGQTTLTLAPTGPTNRATQRSAGNFAALASYKAKLRGANGST